MSEFDKIALDLIETERRIAHEAWIAMLNTHPVIREGEQKVLGGPL